MAITDQQLDAILDTVLPGERKAVLDALAQQGAITAAQAASNAHVTTLPTPPGFTSVSQGINAAAGTSPVIAGDYVLNERDFGMHMHPIHRVEKFHAGQDINRSLSGQRIGGRDVLAFKSGVAEVIPEAKSGGYGNRVEVKHADGYTTTYSHLRDGVSVKTGDRVEAGQKLGKIGTTGGSTGEHLHFEVLNPQQRFVDPKSYLTRSMPEKALKTPGMKDQLASASAIGASYPAAEELGINRLTNTKPIDLSRPPAPLSSPPPVAPPAVAATPIVPRGVQTASIPNTSFPAFTPAAGHFTVPLSVAGAAIPPAPLPSAKGVAPISPASLRVGGLSQVTPEVPTVRGGSVPVPNMATQLVDEVVGPYMRPSGPRVGPPATKEEQRITEALLKGAERRREKDAPSPVREKGPSPAFGARGASERERQAGPQISEKEKDRQIHEGKITALKEGRPASYDFNPTSPPSPVVQPAFLPRSQPPVALTSPAKPVGTPAAVPGSTLPPAPSVASAPVPVLASPSLPPLPSPVIAASRVPTPAMGARAASELQGFTPPAPVVFTGNIPQPRPPQMPQPRPALPEPVLPQMPRPRPEIAPPAAAPLPQMPRPRPESLPPAGAPLVAQLPRPRPDASIPSVAGPPLVMPPARPQPASFIQPSAFAAKPAAPAPQPVSALPSSQHLNLALPTVQPRRASAPVSSALPTVAPPERPPVMPAAARGPMPGAMSVAPPRSGPSLGDVLSRVASSISPSMGNKIGVAMNAPDFARSVPAIKSMGQSIGDAARQAMQTAAPIAGPVMQTMAPQMAGLISQGYQAAADAYALGPGVTYSGGPVYSSDSYTGYGQAGGPAYGGGWVGPPDPTERVGGTQWR